MDPKTLLTNPTNWSMQSSKNYALMKLVLMNIVNLHFPKYIIGVMYETIIRRIME